jgi:hypothetical protein
LTMQIFLPSSKIYIPLSIQIQNKHLRSFPIRGQHLLATTIFHLD